MSKRVEIIIPILSCSDLDRSLEYFKNALGFKVDWTHDGSFASVSRDDWKIYLHANLVGEARGMVWIGIEDIEGLYSEFASSGAHLKGDLIDNPWACELHVLDPDGNLLRFGGEPRTGKSQREDTQG